MHQFCFTFQKIDTGRYQLFNSEKIILTEVCIEYTGTEKMITMRVIKRWEHNINRSVSRMYWECARITAETCHTPTEWHQNNIGFQILEWMVCKLAAINNSRNLFIVNIGYHGIVGMWQKAILVVCGMLRKAIVTPSQSY